MSHAVDYVEIGTITAVIANQHALEIFDEYEVDSAPTAHSSPTITSLNLHNKE